MQTEAKPCSAASAISRRISSSVASGRSRVWSMKRARENGSAAMASLSRGSGGGGAAGDPGAAPPDSRVVVGEDLAVAVAPLRHAVGTHLAHAHPVPEAAAGEEPAGLPVPGSEALGGEERIRYVQRPADGQAFHLHHLAVVALDADLPH